MSNITATALSNTTNKLRVRLRCALSLPLRPPSLSDSLRFTLRVRSAGATPNSTPVNSEVTSVKASTVKSFLTWAVEGMLSPLSVTSNSDPQTASSAPRAPPQSASNKLSVIIWRTMRKRPAPSALRKAISFCRDAACAISRFATFAQAIKSTNPTAPKRINKVGLTLPTICSCSGTRRKFQPVFVSG